MSIKEMSKEDLELLSNKDITNLLLTEKGALNTIDLFKEIVSLLKLPKSVLETKIGDYYTSLTTDKRFILLEDGTWDLRSRHTSDKLVKVIEEDDEEIEDIKEDIDSSSESEEEEEDFEADSEEEDYNDHEDELKDLVILDEDEMDLEQ